MKCNYGNCVSENKCACKPGYFNSLTPCDIEVPPLYNSRYIQKIIPGNSWVYNYISLGDITSDVQLQFQAVEGSATAYILLQSSDFYNLPTENGNSLPIAPTNSFDNTISYLITRQEVQARKGGWLIIALYNSGNLQARVRAQYVATFNSNGRMNYDNDNNSGNPTEDLVKTMIIVPILIVGFVLCIGVYIKSKAERRRDRNRNRIHRQVTPSENPRQNYDFVGIMDQTPPQTPQNQSFTPQNLSFTPHSQSLTPQNQSFTLQTQSFTQHSQSFIQQTPQDKEFLCQKDIQKFFPKKAFSQLQSPFPQAICSICLDDFDLESECHQLYCYHIFHEKCIEEWLAKHDSCPDCRKLMTREAIRKVAKAERKRMARQEQYALLSKYSPNQSPTAQRIQRLQSVHIAH